MSAEKTVPVDTRLSGWAALVQTFGVQAPVRRPSDEVASIEVIVREAFEGFKR